MLFLSVGMDFFLGRTKKETGFLLKACLFFADLTETGKNH